MKKDIYKTLQDCFPIESLVNDMRDICQEHDSLPTRWINIAAETPVFIKTFNKPFKDISVFKFFDGVCKVVFVCSTDDPYLDTFKKEIEGSGAELVIFDKATYFNPSITLDDFPYTDDYNKTSLYARRFINDYAVANNLPFWMDSDNDLKISLRFPDKKTRPYSKELARFAIGVHLYLLDKYPWVSYLSASSPGSQAYGKIYETGFGMSPTNIYFYNKSVDWYGRILDDVITPLLRFELHGDLPLALPIISTDQRLITGEMGITYFKIKNELEESGIIEPNPKSRIGNLGRIYLETAFYHQMKDIPKSLLRPYCRILRRMLEERFPEILR